MNIRDYFIFRYYIFYYILSFVLFLLFTLAVNFHNLLSFDALSLFLFIKTGIFDIVKINDCIVCIVSILYFISTKKKMYFLNFILNGVSLLSLFKKLIFFILIITLTGNILLKDVIHFVHNKFYNTAQSSHVSIYLNDKKDIISFFILKNKNNYDIKDVIIVKKKNEHENSKSKIIFAKNMILDVNNIDSNQMELKNIKMIEGFKITALDKIKIKLKTSQREIVENYNIFIKNFNHLEYYMYEKIKIIFKQRGDGKTIHDIKLQLIGEVQIIFSSVFAFLVVLYFFFNFNRNINMINLSIRSFLTFLVIRNLNFIITNFFVNLLFLEFVMVSVVIQLMAIFIIYCLLYLKEQNIDIILFIKKKTQKMMFLVFILFMNSCTKHSYGSFVAEDVIDTIHLELDQKEIINLLGDPIFKSQDGSKYFYINQLCTSFLFIKCIEKKIKTVEFIFDKDKKLAEKKIYYKK